MFASQQSRDDRPPPKNILESVKRDLELIDPVIPFANCITVCGPATDVRELLERGITFLEGWLAECESDGEFFRNRISIVGEHSADPTPDCLQALTSSYSELSKKVNSAAEAYRTALQRLDSIGDASAWERIAEETIRSAELIVRTKEELELVEKNHKQTLEKVFLGLGEFVTES